MIFSLFEYKLSNFYNNMVMGVLLLLVLALIFSAFMFNWLLRTKPKKKRKDIKKISTNIPTMKKTKSELIQRR